LFLKVLYNKDIIIICCPSCPRYKVEPPGLIQLEKEIELEEKAPPPPPSPVSQDPPLSSSPSSSSSPSPAPNKSTASKKSTGKLLDDAVSQHLLLRWARFQIWTSQKCIRNIYKYILYMFVQDVV
jgi:hypothetical protein